MYGVDDTIALVQGDDYLAADSRALQWSSTSWPSIVGAAISLNLFDPNPPNTMIQKAGTVISATEAQVELNAAATAAIALIAPTWRYALVATLADGHVVTLAQGELGLTAGAQNRDYVTLAELKNSLTLSAQNFADGDLARAITSASRIVDDYTHRRFYPDADANQVRYYTAVRPTGVELDDFISITEFATDPTGTGAYSDIWEQGPDFFVDPPNAQADGHPFERMILRRKIPSYGYGSLSPYGYGGWYGMGKFRWPYHQPQGIQVTGQFGWPEVPSKVMDAVSILAPRLVRRKREAPFAILGLGIEGSTPMRLSSATDPDVCALLDRLQRTVYFG